MRGKKGATRWMAVKLDLKKAYFRLNWVFIWKILKNIGLLVNYVNLIWHYIVVLHEDPLEW